jgi:photoactive yellow protein
MMSEDLPAFDTPHLARAIKALPPALRDRLPYGCILIDREGMVELFSEAERRLSGSGTRRRLGLQFFTEAAPCMNNAAFRGRIERAFVDGQADLEFGWIGDFDNAERSLRVRAQSATGGGCWLFMLREER